MGLIYLFIISQILLCDTEFYMKHFSIYAVTTLLKMKGVRLLTAVFLKISGTFTQLGWHLHFQCMDCEKCIILTENDKIAK